MKFIKMNKTERRGAIVLCCILALSVVFRIQAGQKEQSQVEWVFPEKIMDSVRLVEVKRDSLPIPIKEKRKRSVKSEKIRTLFIFDPNLTSEDSLYMLDIPPKIIANLIKYRRSGGKFSKVEKMKSIYGMTDELYARIEPFVRVKISHIKERININQADEETLKKLKGIGPVLSGRIVKYRNLLGGFYSIHQLKETYGVEDSLFTSIQAQIFAEGDISRLKINTAEIRDLASHPYIDWKKSRYIINYRKQHGPFRSKEDLDKLVLLSEKEKSKIVPYLDFDISQ